MSQRVKKPGRSADDSQGKRRRRRLSGSDADEDGTRSGSNSGGNGSLTGMWTPRHLNDLKVSSIYNRNSAEAPAELYRKDLISAMKLPDSEPLTPEEYWLITDSWKQEWEKGVQVPVNPESLPEPEVKLIQPVADRSHDFRLPKKKYVRVTHDDFFNPDYHQLVSTAARAEKVCSYDLDDVDAAWLGCSNADRAMQNTPLISEFLMEQVIEELELQCWEQVQTILKSQEGLGIEYDENVICDVCRSPESEEGNEMVFCDSCNICVHQACYGITTIPSGSWLCRTCTLGIKPTCVLCPNLGGAMKATRSGHTWAHVACAIWIPEVSIGSVEKMEPITKISSIPQSRWSLVCVLCKEKTGACIQCSVKTCKTAYHVTCAFKNGLEMKPIIVDENAEDGIKLRSYCQKHSVNTKKDKSQSGSEDDAEKKKIKAMTAEERNQARAEKLQQIEAEFYKYVRLKDVSQNLAVDMDIVILIYNYWKLKRKSLNNRPLVPPRPETTQLLTQQQEQDLEQMKMFVQLRQDLERVRNLCYMVSRREKLSRSFFRLREQTFQKQMALLTEDNDLTPEERQAILNANHGPSIYDQFYSHHSSSAAASSSGSSLGHNKSSIPDYDTLIALIAGGVDAKKDLVNGVIKTSKRNKHAATAGLCSTPAAVSAVADAVNSAPSNSTITNTSSSNSGPVNSAVNSDKPGSNPYKKQFVNGARRRNLMGSGSSHSESESEQQTGKSSEVAGETTPAGPKSKKKASSTAVGGASTQAKGTQNKPGNRKPLSFLFDSDSSLDNANPDASVATSHNKKSTAKPAAKGKLKGKALAIAKSSKGVKSTSYFSDSDELELPMGASKASANASKDNMPIYSDSDTEAEDSKPTTASAKKESKVGKATTRAAATKEKAVRKSKSPASAAAKSNLDNHLSKHQTNEISADADADTKQKRSSKEKGTVSNKTSPGTRKGKVKTPGSKKGRNKGGFDPTELIVPQREAAKKATESIRNVKQKTKDQQLSNAEGGLESNSISGSKEDISKEGKVKAASKTAVSTLSDSESEEKTLVKEKLTSKKGKSPERKIGSGKGSKKSAIIATQSLTAVASVKDEEDEEDETGDMDKDEFDFDLDMDGNSSKNVSYVPQRQAAKKAAEHIRSGLSNIVAARLIIEDEMELSRKKTKLEKGQAVPGRAAASASGKEDDSEESRIASAAESSKIASVVAEAAKRVTSKDKGSSKGPVKVGKGGKKESSSLAEQHAGVVSTKPGLNKEGRLDWSFLRTETGGSTRLSAGLTVEKNGDTAGLGRTSQSKTDRHDNGFRASDKGSLPACRRNRERTSSSTSSSGSSGSSSSGSSCSSRSSSASSSRSSSAESASPEPRSPVVSKKVSKQQTAVSPVAAATKPSSVIATKDKGPGRKLKTSERCPNNNRTKLRTETASREKPAPKGGRSTKSGPGRGDPFRSAFSPSPEPEPKPAGKQQREQHDNLSTPANNNKVSPLSKTNEQQQREQQQRLSKSKSRSPSSSIAARKTFAESPETKGSRRKGESSAKTKQTDKTRQSDTAGENGPSTKASLASNRKSPAKQQHTGPYLSSESEPEDTDSLVCHSKAEASTKNPTNSRVPPTSESSSASPQRKRKSNSEGGGSLGLSESEDSGADEKENSCIPAASSEPHYRGDVPDQHHHHSSSTTVAPSKSSPQKTSSQKNSTPSASQPSSILSPLTPTENKEKELQQQLSHHGILPKDSDQPESKRPRLDSIQAATVPSTSSGQLKSFFSPPGSTGGGRDGEILDFDSELYDLARSVVTDEYHGDEMNSSGSLSFSFSQELFSREDNKEDSARATLNLVEKLRLQHARKSGTNHRPSTESSSDTPCDNLLDEPLSRPSSGLQDEKKVDLSNENMGSEEPVVALEIRTADNDKSASHSQGPSSYSSSFDPPRTALKSPSLVSPDRTKQSIQGDERWVPPSGGNQDIQHPARGTPVSGPNHVATQPHTSPRTTSLPEISPPVPKQLSASLQSYHQQSGMDEETAADKHHLLRSPASSYHDLASSSHSQLHGSHSSLSMESSDKGNSLSVDTHPSSPAVSCSPLISPVIPGLHQGRIPAGSTAAAAAAALAAAAAGIAAAEASPSLINPATGLPFSANPFMYPHLPNNSAALASMVSSLAAAAGPNHPLAHLLQQVPLPKASPGVLGGPLSPSNFPFPPTSVQQALQQQVQQQATNIPCGQGTVKTPTMSPTVGLHGKQRRPSDVTSMADGKLPLSSPLVSVAASMPPLAKPPLTSPSVLLTSHVKTVTPPVPQSAVAHIIESVVNNHSTSQSGGGSTNLPKTTLSLLDMHMPPVTIPTGIASASTIASIKTPLTSPVVSASAPQKHQPQQPSAGGNDTGISAVLANKTTENIISGVQSKTSNRDRDNTVAINTDITPSVAVTNAQISITSPKQSTGRGRRGSAVKSTAATLKAAEKLSGVDAVIGDMMMSPQPKAKGRKGAAHSPGRGKALSTPVRRGRGKGKGKNVIGVRKDLAGTVYDIDFDEFEENSEEKIDLRALRERRKSSDVHASEEKVAGGKHSNKRTSSDRDHQGPILLTLSVPHGDKHSSRHRHKEDKEAKGQHRREKKEQKEKEKEAQLLLLQQQQQQQQQQQLTVPPISIKVDASTKTLTSTSGRSEKGASKASSNKDMGIPAILQAPLPGPVDMRCYSASTSSSTSTNVTGEESITGKIGFPAAKDPSSEIASLFMSGSEVSGGAGTSTTVNDLEELDKALEVLVSAPKPPTDSTSSSLTNAIPSPIGPQSATTSSSHESAVKDVIHNTVTCNNSQASKIQNNTQNQPTGPMVNSGIPPPVAGGVSFEQIATKQLDITSREQGINSFNKTGNDIDHLMPPSASVESNNSSDLPRNQLKFKIKGPFLDANYSSTNSMHHGVVPDNLHHHHSLHQQPVGSGGIIPHLGTGTGPPPIYPPSVHSGSYGGAEPGTYPPGHPHHQHHSHQWMMSSMMGSSNSSSNTSNLRRMRKKELLRQYWTQDMNMDGGSNFLPGFPPGAATSGSMPDMPTLTPNQQGSHPHHPLSRSVITIPKAVASMSILPTKEDYRLDDACGNDSNDSNEPGSNMGDIWSGNTGFGLAGAKGLTGGKNEGTQRKKRSRGIYREMAALGIIPPDAQPRERRRDRASAVASSGNSGGTTPDKNSRKRKGNNDKPSRSTFIPPTLAECVDSPAGSKAESLTSVITGTGSSVGGGALSSKGNSSTSQPSATAVSASLVNHPTPKLKIKFGDLSNSTSAGGNSSQSTASNIRASFTNNSNHLSDSDKETPNKKAKGRPPKKRGLVDAASSSSSMSTSSAGFSMEELKRESMKYREMIMKDYAMAEQQEILKLSGTRRSKKKGKRKAASGAGSETDDGSVRSKSPEVKVIDGPKPKLIVRFGKSRAGGGTAGSGSDAGSTGGGNGDNGVIGKVNENGLPDGRVDENSIGDGMGEGSSSGNVGNAALIVDDFSARNSSQNGSKDSNKPVVLPNNNNNGSNRDKILVLELDNTTAALNTSASLNSSSCLNDQQITATTTSSSSSAKAKSNVPSESSSSSTSSSSSAAATVPIRLKLSRCYEGYSLKNKDGITGKLDAVERESCGASNAAKQSDSCQVR